MLTICIRPRVDTPALIASYSVTKPITELRSKLKDIAEIVTAALAVFGSFFAVRVGVQPVGRFIGFSKRIAKQLVKRKTRRKPSVENP